jgi:hypothetical protein
MMPHERRTSIRKPLEHLSYISLPPDNGGVVCDVSEGGLCFHAISPVKVDGPIQVRFAVDSAERFTATGELAWLDETGTVGGLRFTDLPEEIRERIRLWAGQPRLQGKAGSRPRFDPVAALTSHTTSQTSPKPRTTASSIAQATAKPTAVDVLVAEPAVKIEAREASPAVSAGAANIPLVPSVAKATPAPQRKAELLPANWRSNPSLYNLRPPVYSAPHYDLSMFSLEAKVPEQVTTAAAAAALRSIAKEHPIATIGLTVGLAFLVSMGILALVALSWPVK